MSQVVAVVVEEVMVVAVIVVATAAAAATVGTGRGGVSVAVVVVTVVVNMYSNAGPHLVQRKGCIFAACWLQIRQTSSTILDLASILLDRQR